MVGRGAGGLAGVARLAARPRAGAGAAPTRSPRSASLLLQANDDQSPSTLNHYIHLQERPIKQTISR